MLHYPETRRAPTQAQRREQTALSTSIRPIHLKPKLSVLTPRLRANQLLVADVRGFKNYRDGASMPRDGRQPGKKGELLANQRIEMGRN